MARLEKEMKQMEKQHLKLNKKICKTCLKQKIHGVMYVMLHYVFMTTLLQIFSVSSARDVYRGSVIV